MMTEAEAKTKWCPFARVDTSSENRDGQILGIAGGGNRMKTSRVFSANPDEARCIGSDCMAWRWGMTPVEAASLHDGAATGYCGLAGGADA